MLTALVLVVGACSGPSGSNKLEGVGIYGLGVSGPMGTEPTVRIAAPLVLKKTSTEVVTTGTGPPIQIDQLFALELTLYDARTGKRAASTYDAGQLPLLTKSTADTLFPALSAALIGKRQGSRVAMALTASDAFGTGGVPPTGVRASDPIVLVADILAVPPATSLPTAQGRTVTPPAGTPSVKVIAGDPTEIDVPAGQSPPSGVTVVPLIQGTGPVVRNDSLVVIDYLGQVWGSHGAFTDTYFKEPAVVPIGLRTSMPAWNKALVGVHRGTRLLVIDPNAPSASPGVVAVPSGGTIAWVIDVLGVS